MGGGLFPSSPTPGEQEAQTEKLELEKEKADRTAKARQLMLKRLQTLRRRGGGVGGGAVPQADQQDLLGG